MYTKSAFDPDEMVIIVLHVVYMLIITTSNLYQMPLDRALLDLTTGILSIAD